MAKITKPYTFADGQTAEAPQVNSDFDTVYNLVNGNIDNTNLASNAAIPDSMLSQITTAGKVANTAINIGTTSSTVVAHDSNGDIADGAWADYSASSTIVGWTSFTKKLIYTKKIGKTVFVQFDIEGTSNDTVATFTIPYTVAAGITNYASINVTNNGGTSVMSYLSATASGVTVACYATAAGAAWTNSGTKAVVGQFFYQAA